MLAGGENRRQGCRRHLACVARIGREGEDIRRAFFVAEGFVHLSDGLIADQSDGDFGTVEAELFAHTSKKCFEWRPGDADGSLAVQNHCWVNIADLVCESRLRISFVNIVNLARKSLGRQNAARSSWQRLVSPFRAA